MKCQIIGVEHREGDFTPKDKPGTLIHYDNLVLHECHRNRAVVGSAVGEIKMKMAQAADLIAEGGGDMQKLVGRVIDFDTDRFGKVLGWEFSK